MKCFLLILHVLFSGLLLAQSPIVRGPIDEADDLSKPEVFLRDPRGLNNPPGHTLTEVDAAAIPNYLVRRYFSELGLRHVFRDAESVMAEFGLSRGLARDVQERYQRTLFEVERFVRESISEPCERNGTSEAALRQWADYFNSRQDVISQYYGQLLEEIDVEVSSELAAEIRNRVEDLAPTVTLPIRHIGPDSGASHEVLLEIFNMTCSAGVPSF